MHRQMERGASDQVDAITDLWSPLKKAKRHNRPRKVALTFGAAFLLSQCYITIITLHPKFQVIYSHYMNGVAFGYFCSFFQKYLKPLFES